MCGGYVRRAAKKAIADWFVCSSLLINASVLDFSNRHVIGTCLASLPLSRPTRPLSSGAFNDDNATWRYPGSTGVRAEG